MEYNSYTIMESYEHDLCEISTFFKNNDLPLWKPEILDWKYLQNPAGKARVFLIRDTSTNNIKGTLAYLPRTCLDRKGAYLLVMQAVDAFISPDARGKSLYPKLLYNSMRVIDLPIYGFPNEVAEAIERKCGWRILAPFQSCYFPLEIGRVIPNWNLDFLARLFNLIAKGYSFVWLGKKSKKIRLNAVNKFEHNFNGCINSFCGDRSFNYLNWRFTSSPLNKYNCFELYYEGKVIGYCVVAIKDHVAVMYDFAASCKIRKCLKEIIEHLRKKGLTHLLFKNTGLRLWRYGFLKENTKSNIIEYKLPTEPWVFTVCDSDWG